jgi:translocation and assembly module TamA
MAARATRSRPGPITIVLVAIVTAASACALPRGTAESPVVMDFRIHGLDRHDEADLIAVLATQELERTPAPIIGPLWDALGWKIGRTAAPRLDADALSVDRRRVEAYLRERGHFEAKVEDVWVHRAGAGRVRVAMDVDEGEPVKVTRIAIEGLDAAPEAKARLRKTPIAVGDVFTVEGYDALKAAIENALHETGWAKATVTQRAQILPGERAAELTYVATPGPRYRFGSIFVSGTTAVPRELIREQVRIELEPGKTYALSRMAKAQARVFDLGVFGGVRVNTGPGDEKRQTLPVVVSVREAPFRTLRFGPGVGIESSRIDTNLLFGWSHRNWFGDLRHLQLELRLGYAWLLAQQEGASWYQLSPLKRGPDGLFTADFSQPGVITRRIDAAVRLELERGLEFAYDFWSERVRLSLPFRITPRFTFVPSYNFELYQVDDSTAVPGPPGEDGPELGEVDISNCPSGICLLSYLEQRLTYDGRDDPVNTRRGFLVSLSVQEGVNLFNHGYGYLRVVPEARGYLPLGERWVLAARALVGALVPLGEEEPPPIVARFFSGGASAMRGFYARQLSPGGLDEGEFVPLGGNGIVETQLELRYDLTASLAAVAFGDAASVSLPSPEPDAWEDAVRSGGAPVRYAAGLGFRYRTPVGPIRLDAAWRFGWNAPPPVAGQPLLLSADEDGGLAVHITIGEAF